jgi:hypothetical protein
VQLAAACGGDAGEFDARGPTFIDAGLADADPCESNAALCNLLTQTGCNQGDKCAWVRVSDECGGSPTCVPGGDVPVGGSCSWGPVGPTTGYDNCVIGAICSAEPDASTGTCERVCSPWDATLPCPSGSACAVRAGLFSDEPNETPLAGICEPSCNPLAQTRDSDGAPVCGSVDPSLPDRGCYGFPSATASPTDFRCLAAGTLGHREAATPPIVTNSCLPGAIPLLRESSGSMQVVCIAMCAPLTINYTQPDEARDGAEPYSCPEMPLAVGVIAPARATGPNERCQHLWFFEGDGTPLTAASNAYGFCVDPTKYTWDHDQMPATPPEPWPMPETLIPYAQPTPPLSADTDLAWGYAPYPTSLTGQTPRPRRAADLGFRPALSGEPR